MQFEIFAYLATFIISAGLAVIGISISYQLYRTYQKSVFQILLYQQIFLFSFFIYGIWGNLFIRELIADFNLSAELTNKIALFIPMIGIPFLIVSWFMFIKFGYNLVGLQISRGFVYSFFPVLIFIPILITLLVHKGKIKTPLNPDLFIIQILLVLNIAIHFLVFTPFLFGGAARHDSNKINFDRKYIWLYITGVIIYSIALNYYFIFGYISTCSAIIILFGVNVLVPLFFQTNLKKSPLQKNINVDFTTFCKIYEISKRESEVINEICTGKTNKAISEKLFITLQTVKDHTHRIYTKTGVKSRVQLANLVREKTGK